MSGAQFEEQIAGLSDKMRDYHAAIGRLMLKWAETETLLYRLLLHYGKLSDAVGRALLSGTRASSMIEFLRAVAENTEMPEDRKSDLYCVFEQMATINTMRDRIVHHGLWVFSARFPDEDSYAQWISNVGRASRKSNSFRVPVSTVSIDLMIGDLFTIAQHLNRHLSVGSEENFLPHRAFADASTWLYKFPQPTSTKGKSGVTARKRSRQHRPSQK